MSVENEETIGARLRRLRKNAGLTQAQLAALSGVGQSAIGNIEAGTRGYGASVIFIAKALKTQPEILQAIGRVRRSDSAETAPLSVEIQFVDDAALVAEFARRIKAIPREQREPLRNEVSALVMSPDSEETRAALTHYLTQGGDRLPTTTTEMIVKNRENHAAKSDTSKDSVRG